MAESELSFEEKERIAELAKTLTPLLLEYHDLILKAYDTAVSRGEPMDIQMQLFFANVRNARDELKRGGLPPVPFMLAEQSMN